MCELTSEEKQLELEFMSNYIIYVSMQIASDIKSIYKYYSNDYPLSLERIIECSKDEYKLSNEENKLFHKMIKHYLEMKYKLKIISEDNEKLKLEEL